MFFTTPQTFVNICNRKMQTFASFFPVRSLRIFVRPLRIFVRSLRIFSDDSNSFMPGCFFSNYSSAACNETPA